MDAAPRLFRSDGFRPVRAWDATDAAKIFATRWAQQNYGRNGYCHHVRLDSWTESGSTHHYEAFVGVPADNGCVGKNIWLTVYRRRRDPDPATAAQKPLDAA